MIELNGSEFRNWQEYFSVTFELTGKYRRSDEGLQGDTLFERYIPLDNNDKTEIVVGYLRDKLIDWKFENPQTPGYSRQQDMEYFYRYDFTPGQMYGGPGLEFIDINVSGIDKQLKEGLKGREVQYYRNGQMVKSKIYIDFEGKQGDFYTTIYFEKVSRWRQFINIFFGDKNEIQMTTKTIYLPAIFPGLNNRGL